MPNYTPEAQDYQDDLEMWGHCSANLTLMDNGEHVTDLMVDPVGVRTIFRALRDEANAPLRAAPPTPEQRAQQVLDNHVIRDDWKRNGAQIRKLLIEAIELERSEQ